MFRLEHNFDKSKSIYTQIIDEIKKAIIRGELSQGSQIPSQREYAVTSHVNPNTVQRAYREMERMNLVETVRGQGTFICKSDGMVEQIRNEMAGDVLGNFIEEMRSIGFSNETIKIMLNEHLNRLQDGRIQND